VPTNVVDVKVPAGQTLQASMANDVQIKQVLVATGAAVGCRLV